ncbi:hypothetical protein AB6N23_03815 [Cellulomonas sp. 179-A 9B4 NHS]|uniref:hypothetical protein n=1 Tax=Cellulomonas sp. 179-A 9B4 NHS TaxID=3142379 RepID=UPI0039A0C2EE
MTSDADSLTLQVADGGTMLHTAECPHLGPDALASLRPATDEQLETLPTCASCRALLDGGRRQTFTSLEPALESLPVPLENRRRVREIAAGLTFTAVWIPASRSYVAVAEAPGITAAAYINKGFVDVRRPGGGYDRELLPHHGTRGRRGPGAHADAPPRTCPSCHMQLPASGVCDDCGA